MADEEGGGGFDFDIFAKLHLAIGGIRDEIRESDRRRAAAAMEAQGRRATVNRDVTIANGATSAVLAVGSPERGFFWQLRRLAITGSPVTSLPAGMAYVYVRADSPVNADTQGFVDYTGQAFPTVVTYGRDEVTILEREGLWLLFENCSAGVQYVAIAELWQFPIAIYRETLEV